MKTYVITGEELIAACKRSDSGELEPDSQQRMVSLPKGARLEEVKITIGQDSDCCADDNLGNTLEIETPDGGGGKYITIKGRWAMDDENEINALADMLKDVLRRAG